MTTLPGKMERLTRAVEFERAEDGSLPVDDAGRFPMCISTEAPVERGFGMEILDHGASSVDLARFRRGLPLLVDHDTGDQVGIIEDPVLGEDRKLRGMARFGGSARAQEIKQDVIDGIRKDLSVGYRIRKLQLESKGEGYDTYRAMSWVPLEASIVAVPADIEAGVGRSGEDSALPVELEAVPQAPTGGVTEEVRMAEVPAAPEGAKVTTVERGDVAEIARLGKEFGCMDRVSDWLEKGRSVADVQKEIMGVLSARAEKTLTEAGKPALDIPKREVERYNLARAIMAQASGDWSKAGFEREVSDQFEKRMDGGIKRNGGFFVPTEIPVTRAQPPLVAGTASVGGNVVFTEPMSFIEMLRNSMVVNALGAQTLTGLKGPVAFPRQLTAGTASFTAEAATIAGSYLTLGQLTMNAKELKSHTSYSRMLLTQSTPDIDQLVRNDLALIHALAIDSAAISGAGSTAPTGIISTASIGSVTVGGNGGVPTYAQIVGLETSLDNNNALNGNLAFLTTPGIRGLLRQTTKLTNTAALPVWGDDNTMVGYKALVSNQVPKTLTKGTSTTVCHAVIFGNWRELLIGEWAGGFEIVTDPYSLADYGIIKLVTYQLVDVGVRHAASFAADLDFTLS